MNGAWLVLGINGVTRDTPLLEFSQVRANSYRRHSTTFMSAKPLNEKPFFLSLFLLFFQLIKEREMDTKEHIRGDMKMNEGERGSLGQTRRGAAQPESAAEWLRGSAELRPLLFTFFRELDEPPSPPKWLQHTFRLVLRSRSYRLYPSGFSEGAARK